jgi:hypothetical protein
MAANKRQAQVPFNAALVTSQDGGRKSAKQTSRSSSSSSYSISASTVTKSIMAFPRVVIMASLEWAETKDFSRLDCVARDFHGSMLETVLRRLAQRATGVVVPLGDPPRNMVASRMWTQRLLREMHRRWWKLPSGTPKVENVTASIPPHVPRSNSAQIIELIRRSHIFRIILTTWLSFCTTSSHRTAHKLVSILRLQCALRRSK